MYQIIISPKNKLLRTPMVRTTKYGLNSVKYAGAINGITSLWKCVNQVQLMVSKLCLKTFDIRVHVIF